MIILTLVLGMVVMFCIMMRLRHLWMVRSFPSATIQRMVYTILKQAEEIPAIASPEVALVKSRECQAAMYTLIQLVDGGQSSVDAVCGVDTEKALNILNFQQREIEKWLHRSDGDIPK